ncbi:unnamed protein product [Closterium sp. NIES-54]
MAASGQATASSQVSASGQLAASCSCRLLSLQTLLWHHHLGHPSLLRLRSMHTCLLVFGLPRSSPPLPRTPALPCLPCVKGWQRAAPHSSEFPPTTAALQTLHMDVWGPAPVSGTDQERYFLLVVDDYTRYTTVFPFRRKADIIGVLILWIRATCRQLRERFSQDFPVLHLHSHRGAELSSHLLAEFCRDEGIHQSFMLPASPQQNGIAERRIGLIMEVARTSIIHAAAPHFLWSFATGKVRDASVFRVWGALSLVRDAKTSKLSSRTLRCVFLGFPTDAPPWNFYHPRSHQIFSSQDVTFDESDYFYRLHPHASHPGPAPSGVSQVDPPPLVEPLKISSHSSGPIEGGDPAADDTAATRRSPRLETAPGFPPRSSSPPPQLAAMDFVAESAGAKPGGVETEGEGSGGAATGGASSGGATTGGADSGGAASPSGGGAMGDPAGGPRAGQPPQPDLLETLSPQQIREWIFRRGSPGGGGFGPAGAGAASPGGTAGGAGGTAGGATGAGGTRGAAGAGGTGGAGGAGAASSGGAAGAGGAGAATGGGAAGAGGAGGAGAASAGDAGDASSGGAAGAGGAGAASAGGPAGTGGAGAASAGGAGAASAGGAADAGGAASAGVAGAASAGGAAGVGGAGAATAGGTAGAGGAGPADALRHLLGLPPAPTEFPVAGTTPMLLFPSAESLTEQREPETRASTPERREPETRASRVVLPSPPASSLPDVADPPSDLARASIPTITCLLATVVTDRTFLSPAAFALVSELVDFAAVHCLDYLANHVSDPEPACPLSIGGELALGCDALEDGQEEMECLAAAAPHLATMLLAPEGDPDALDIPTPRSYREAVLGEYSSQW